ncbi:6-phosphogluconolactonase [Alkalimarinus coralli]|uniref:6-phosphogluconolactonase n=1 Tax=Alkalimarinus coralli TaxID=2935863 RepID=UPI00202B5C23|nr:6-phosphogluconolactonase [Alkalimarinus coralli]
MIERLFNNHQEMLNELVDTIARDISRSIKESGETSLAVSGGTTPVNLYDGLSLVDLSWHNVTITLTDERWVPVDHTASNERMVRQHLLQNSAQGARFISLKTHHPSAEKAEAELEKYLQNELPSLDLVILGMGADGHFASLFPHSDVLAKGLDLSSSRQCLATFAPSEPKERISLTLAKILTAKKIYLLMTGEDKLAVYRRACKEINASAVPNLPITAVLKQDAVPVTVFWAATSDNKAS